MRGLLLAGIIAAIATSLGACFATADHNQLTRRAAFDLNCPAASLSMTQIDDTTVGVRGCGQQAAYVESCDGPRTSAMTECTWVKNGGAAAPAR